MTKSCGTQRRRANRPPKAPKSARRTNFRSSAARRCRQWQAHHDRIDPARLVFIDEIWTTTNPVLANKHRRRRYALRAGPQRPQGSWPLDHHDLLRRNRVDASWLIEGPIMANFPALHRQGLVLTLRPGHRHMDNLGSQGRGTQALFPAQILTGT